MLYLEQKHNDNITTVTELPVLTIIIIQTIMSAFEMHLIGHLNIKCLVVAFKCRYLGFACKCTESITATFEYIFKCSTFICELICIC